MCTNLFLDHRCFRNVKFNYWHILRKSQRKKVLFKLLFFFLYLGLCVCVYLVCMYVCLCVCVCIYVFVQVCMHRLLEAWKLKSNVKFYCSYAVHCFVRHGISLAWKFPRSLGWLARLFSSFQCWDCKNAAWGFVCLFVFDSNHVDFLFCFVLCLGWPRK